MPEGWNNYRFEGNAPPAPRYYAQYDDVDEDRHYHGRPQYHTSTRRVVDRGAAGPATCCSFSPGEFWCALLTGLIILAIIGGIVGGIYALGKDNDSGSNNSTKSTTISPNGNTQVSGPATGSGASPAGPSASTAAWSSVGTGASTPGGPSAGPGASTAAGPGASTPTGPSAGPGASTPTGPSAGPGASTLTGPSAGPGASTPTGPSAGPGASTAAGPSAGSGPSTLAGSSAGPGASTVAGSSAGPGASTLAGSSAVPGASTPGGPSAGPGASTPGGPSAGPGASTPGGSSAGPPVTSVSDVLTTRSPIPSCPTSPVTIYQRIDSTPQEFNKSYAAMKSGFGSLSGNYWRGLDDISTMTQNGKFKLNVTFEVASTNAMYLVTYSIFTVGPESSGYQMTIGGFSGNSTFDGFQPYSGYTFAAYDQATGSSNCPVQTGGAWWYGDSCSCGACFTQEGPDKFIWSLGFTKVVLKRAAMILVCV